MYEVVESLKELGEGDDVILTVESDGTETEIDATVVQAWFDEECQDEIDVDLDAAEKHVGGDVRSRDLNIWEHKDRDGWGELYLVEYVVNVEDGEMIGDEYNTVGTVTSVECDG